MRLKNDTEKIACRFCLANKTNLGAIYVEGVGGGFDTPADELYSYLSEKLKQNDISSLRARSRNPINLEEAVYDAIAGIMFFENEGISKILEIKNLRFLRIALFGHSLGGAVVIHAEHYPDQLKQ